MTSSSLTQTLEGLARRAAAAVVARSRSASPGLNAALLRRLSAAPGEPESFLADPVFEGAKTWAAGDRTLGDLAGGLLHPRLVDALDGAPSEQRLARDLRPFRHQQEAWEAASKGRSYIVTSGTGSGKTECFMVPILDDLLREPGQGRLAGVRAIVVYPLNALIESQRERLAAWTAPLKDRLRFALYNSHTAETPGKMDKARIAPAEIGNRQELRATPPNLLVTNVTMLEYLLLRSRDKPLLEASQGRLRWIVLDEAHSYIGAQAAEMALLLRRVRAAFAVEPSQTRLIATSATVSEGEATREKLAAFVADLAGVGVDRVQVIEGRTSEARLPPAAYDEPLDATPWRDLAPQQLWRRLAPHPRVQRLRNEMRESGVTARRTSEILLGRSDPPALRHSQEVLDAAARARETEAGLALLPWRAHVFHRPLGGLWACVDPACPHRDPELQDAASRWPFGAVRFAPHPACDCGAPIHAVRLCDGCGAPHFEATQKLGVLPVLGQIRGVDGDDFALDAEPPGEDDEAEPTVEPAQTQRVVLAAALGDRHDVHLRCDDGAIFDNAPPEGARAIRLALFRSEKDRLCCDDAAKARLAEARFGPAFLMGDGLPYLVERLAEPAGEGNLPCGGRRTLTFSDSRQGSARLAAKLQQEAERNLTRAFLYHSVQQEAGLAPEQRSAIERELAVYRSHPEIFGSKIVEAEQMLSGESAPIEWKNLVARLADHAELRAFAGDVWRSRYRGWEMADDRTLLAQMFLKRELGRRPRVQNNAETLGLVRLAFPALEAYARVKGPPDALKRAGVEGEGWVAILLMAVDSIFRENLAIDVSPHWMAGLVSPRSAGLNAVCRSDLARDARPHGARAFPTPRPKGGRLHRLIKLVFA